MEIVPVHYKFIISLGFVTKYIFKYYSQIVQVFSIRWYPHPPHGHPPWGLDIFFKAKISLGIGLTNLTYALCCDYFGLWYMCDSPFKAYVISCKHNTLNLPKIKHIACTFHQAHLCKIQEQSPQAPLVHDIKSPMRRLLADYAARRHKYKTMSKCISRCWFYCCSRYKASLLLK